MSASQEITRLLQGWSDGDEQALAKLTPVLYKELHRMGSPLHAAGASRPHAANDCID
jgi:ECF sigma factor